MTPSVDVVRHAPIAIARRSGFDECVHFGSVVALGTAITAT